MCFFFIFPSLNMIHICKDFLSYSHGNENVYVVMCYSLFFMNIILL